VAPELFECAGRYPSVPRRAVAAAAHACGAVECVVTHYRAPDLAVAAAAGVAGALALGALWTAMARGMIGLASPISATGVLVPVIYGLARGDSPSLLQLVAASLYSAVTVILGVRVLHERLGRGQRAGVLVALIRIAVIAAG
jgi:drug/metabolite transporter (DMT)-like permease